MGGWSGDFVPAGGGGGGGGSGATRKLKSDTGEEDLASAMVVFPGLLRSNDAIPAGVRDAVISAVLAATAAEDAKESGRKQPVGGVGHGEKKEREGGTSVKETGPSARQDGPGSRQKGAGRKGAGGAMLNGDGTSAVAAAITAAVAEEEGWETDDSADDFE
ncbi:unnamed protein product [Ectocarpus sp. 13 AM-2016]